MPAWVTCSLFCRNKGCWLIPFHISTGNSNNCNTTLSIAEWAKDMPSLFQFKGSIEWQNDPKASIACLGAKPKTASHKQFTSMAVVARASGRTPTWMAMHTASYTSDTRSVITSLDSISSLSILISSQEPHSHKQHLAYGDCHSHWQRNWQAPFL